MHRLQSLQPEPDARPGDKSRDRGGMSMRPGQLDTQDFTKDALAENLGYTVQRVVLDKTGLTGEYSFALNWTPEEQMDAGVNGSDAGTETGPFILTALQVQMGFKLNASKAPVQTLVIDHVEMPTKLGLVVKSQQVLPMKQGRALW